MPGCNDCGGSTPALIRVGTGLTVTGSGTLANPYDVEVDYISLAAALNGESTASIPINTAGALTDLSDYDDDTAPNDGDVVTWVAVGSGGHWESQPPSTTATVTDIDASDITEGILSLDRLAYVVKSQNALGTQTVSADWNSLIQPGMYRTSGVSGAVNTNAPSSGTTTAYLYGTLTVTATGNSVTQTYTESSSATSGATVPGSLYWRTKYGASDWTPWGKAVDQWHNLHFSGSDAVAVGTGFSLQQAQLLRTGNVVWLYLYVKTTSAITNTSATGNIANTALGSLGPTGWQPEFGAAGLTVADQGTQVTGFVNSTGAITLATVPSGTDNANAYLSIPTNYAITLSGSWIAKEL